MMKSNFEHWLRTPQPTISRPSPLRGAALAGAVSGRPARLAALIAGAAFCASLAMPATPADARNLRFGHQHVAGGVKVGLFGKGANGWLGGVHRGRGSQHYYASH